MGNLKRVGGGPPSVPLGIRQPLIPQVFPVLKQVHTALLAEQRFHEPIFSLFVVIETVCHSGHLAQQLWLAGI